MAVVLLALPMAVVGLLVALARRVVVTVGVDEHGGVVEIARHTRRWRVGGLLLGGSVAVLLLVLGQRFDALGRATALAPMALGTGVLLGTIVGELTARPAVGIRRSAVIETRTLSAILPRGRAVVLAGSTALLVGALALGVAWASPDDLGRAGRVFARTCAVVDPDLGRILMGGSHGPWPGSFYAVPLAVALAVLGVLVVVALRVIVARPRPEVDSRGLDTLLRRWAAGNVLDRGDRHRARHARAGGAAGLLRAPADPVRRGLGQRLVAWTAAVIATLAVGAAFGLLAGLVLPPTIRVDDLPRPLPGEAAPVGAPVR